MNKTVSIALSLLLLFGAAASGQDQDYIRFREGPTEQDGALQIAVETYTRNGVTLDLYGVVHMADEAYYQEIQRDLDQYDVVLYEGIKQGDTPNQETVGLNAVQAGMARLLGLQFQKEGIDYTRPNLVHADMDASTLEDSLDGESISPLGGIISPDLLEQLEPVLRIAGDLLDQYLEFNPEIRTTFKLQFAQQMAGTDVEDQLTPQMRQAIIIDRNQIVMDVLAEQERTTNNRTYAIFYGAGHNADFRQRLEDEGWTRGSKRWMTAWSIGQGASNR